MIIDLVDDIEYSKTNCYSHQLTKCLNDAGAMTVALSDVHRYNPNIIICRLKQRTVFRVIDSLKKWIGTKPIVFFDQDPWHAFMDDSPFKGTYDKLLNFNLKAIAVTTEYWATYLSQRNLPGQFVKMGMLPQYCDVGPSFEERKVSVGFIGTMHPHRAQFIQKLQHHGITVESKPNSLGYQQYLNALHDVKIFIHSEDAPIVVDNKQDNLEKGLWIKDVEASARGCFSLRNNADGSSSYCSDIPTIKLFDSAEHAAKLIHEIIGLNSEQRNSIRYEAVKRIRDQNDWQVTAKKLIQFAQ